MKIPRLLESESLPEYPDIRFAVKTLAVIFIASLLFSLAAHAIYGNGEFEQTVLLALIFTASFMIFLVLYLLSRFPGHFKSLLAKPGLIVKKGLPAYLLLLPFLVMALIISALFFMLAGLEPVPQEIVSFYFKTDSLLLLASLFIISSIVAPLAEEIIFRGVLHHAIRSRFSRRFSVVVSSLIFALFHHELFSFVALFFLGCALAYLYERYNNLWVPIGVHFFNNLFSNIIIFSIKFMDIGIESPLAGGSMIP